MGVYYSSLNTRHEKTNDMIVATDKNHNTIPSSKNEQAFVVNWIDSKGLFADEETFQENYDQLKSYTNRYGPGMVIYWHGYVSSLDNRNDEMILICDHFPTHWIFPTGEPADGRIPLFDKI